VRGFVAVTDPGWYERLSVEPGPKDANFWRPSTRAFRHPVGTPFLFKLKAPHHAIAGYGFFAGFSILPDWLAWETFGAANGVADLVTLRTRLAKIQSGARIAGDTEGRIGCCLLAESRFFAPDAWVRAPRDWKRTTQVGVGMDLTAGEGLRIWRECLERTTTMPNQLRESTDRYGTPTLRAPRLGQAIFRVSVLDAYERACAVTHEHSLPVLEAAHIKPYADHGEHRVDNGLALRSDVHRLFDRGYVTVDGEGRFVVSARLKQDYDNGREYYAMHGRQIAVPDALALRPREEALAWHREHVFVG